MAKPFSLEVAEWAMTRSQGVTKEQVMKHFNVGPNKARIALNNICYTSSRYTATKVDGVMRVTHIRTRREIGTANNMVPVAGTPVPGSNLPPVQFPSGRAASQAGYPASCVMRAVLNGKPYAGYYWRKV